MLEAYPAAYKAVAVRGPQIPKLETPAYTARLEKATRRVLGEDGSDGKTYTASQQALFPWYTHLFLGRGKPATHVLALASIDDKSIEATLPPVLKRLRERIAAKT